MGLRMDRVKYIMLKAVCYLMMRKLSAYYCIINWDRKLSVVSPRDGAGSLHRRLILTIVALRSSRGITSLASDTGEQIQARRYPFLLIAMIGLT